MIGITPIYLIYNIHAYDSPYNVVVDSCGDVRTESRSAGVDTVQAKRKNGRLWKENRRLLSRSGKNVC